LQEDPLVHSLAPEVTGKDEGGRSKFGAVEQDETYCGPAGWPR
jgi:hypothetical protein